MFFFEESGGAKSSYCNLLTNRKNKFRGYTQKKQRERRREEGEEGNQETKKERKKIIKITNETESMILKLV
jgi:hypothetical protein